MSTSQPKIYYSHALCTYNQPIEERALRRIKREFPGFHIENPAQYGSKLPFKFFESLVDKCDLLVFSRLEGQITYGVGGEINHALRFRGRTPVFELPEAGGYLGLITRPVDYLSREASIQLYRQWAKKQGIEW